MRSVDLERRRLWQGRSHKKIAQGIRGLVCLVLTVFTILCADAFVEQERLGLQGFVPDNYSNPVLASQPFSAQVAPLNRKAYQLRILLVPPTEVGGQDVILTVECGGGTPVLQHTFTDEELYSEKWITVSLPSEFEQGAACTVRLQSEEQAPERAVRVVMGSAEQTDVTAWYAGQDPQPETPSVTLVYTALRKRQILQVVLFLAAAWLSLLGAATLDRWKDRIPLGVRRLLLCGYAIGCPCVAVWCVEELQQSSVLQIGLRAAGGNLLLLFGAELVAYGLTRRMAVSTALVSLIGLLMGLVNHYLLLFRGTVLLPTDLLGAATAAQVISGYEFKVASSVVCAAAAAALIVCYAFLDRLVLPAQSGTKRAAKAWGLRAAAIVVGAAVAVVPVRQPELFGAELDIYRQQLASQQQNGFLLNFSMNLPLLLRQKPEGYNAEILETYIPAEEQLPEVPAANKLQTEEQLPNLIIIMNESFTDPRTLFEVNEQQESLLPGLDALKEDEAAAVGSMGVSIYGGGTSCSEYELLTGFSMRNDTANFAPYMTYFNRDTYSLAWYVQQFGYETAALHLASAKNWYRNEAYPYAGFRRTIFLDESSSSLRDSGGELEGERIESADYLRNFVSDERNYEILLQMMQQTEQPLFAFNVTIQNHGGYGDEGAEHDPSADPWNTYLSLMNSSDAQFTAFLKELEQFEEPTVVLLFGDHWSFYDEEHLAKLGLQVNGFSAAQQAAYRSTPYVLWSNCGYDFSTMPQQTSACYLGAQVMHQLGFPLSGWQRFRVAGAQRYPLYTYFTVQENGDADALEDYAYRYACLQYNALNDPSHYAEAIFALQKNEAE